MPTNGGKTYVFHIRRGIKFSNGQVLKPSDFVSTFERQFTVPGPTSFYSDFVGASACSTKGCNLSQGVVANDSAYTLTINLTGPDPELMDQLSLPFAYAVPASTSLKLTGNNVPPGTGPYMWKSYNPNTQAVLVRNPYFKQWSATAQPAGYPNEIIEKYGAQVSDEVTAVENDQADEVFDGDQIPSDQLGQLNSPKYAGQVHVNTLTADWYFALNTRRPPFNNLQARQAINYAANRSAYVKIAGGPSLAVPTCQILPPNFPSLRPYCPYTSGSSSTVWSGPDLAKAKALVKAVGHGRDEGGRRRHHRPGRQGPGRADGVRPGLHRLQGDRAAARRPPSSTRSCRTRRTPPSGTSPGRPGTRTTRRSRTS